MKNRRNYLHYICLTSGLYLGHVKNSNKLKIGSQLTKNGNKIFEKLIQKKDI